MLESDLGVTLFERIGKRLILTQTGRSLLAHGQAMEEAAALIELAATRRSQTIEGRVSISATDAYSAYLLPEICAKIRVRAPEVTLVIISSNAISDLRRREADIAIRHIRPDEPELIGYEDTERFAGYLRNLGLAVTSGSF
jgi:DNA-binding transcriptional LysR family regulator